MHGKQGIDVILVVFVQPAHERVHDSHFTLHCVVVRVLVHFTCLGGIHVAHDIHGVGKGCSCSLEMPAKKPQDLVFVRTVHEDDLGANGGCLVANALHVGHHAQAADDKAQILGHRLGFCKKGQGAFVDFVFKIVNVIVVLDDCLGCAHIEFLDGLVHVVHCDFHRGAHHKQPCAQTHNHLLDIVFLLVQVHGILVVLV